LLVVVVLYTDFVHWISGFPEACVQIIHYIHLVSHVWEFVLTDLLLYF